jgi:hypothetical protein
MELLGQDSVSQDSMRENVLLVFPNLNFASLYNSELTPSTGAIDTIPIKYTGDEWKSQESTTTSKSDRHRGIKDMGEVTYFDLVKAVIKSIYN